jgi:hypothetical protein
MAEDLASRLTSRPRRSRKSTLQFQLVHSQPWTKPETLYRASSVATQPRGPAGRHLHLVNDGPNWHQPRTCTQSGTFQTPSTVPAGTHLDHVWPQLLVQRTDCVAQQGALRCIVLAPAPLVPAMQEQCTAGGSTGSATAANASSASVPVRPIEVPLVEVVHPMIDALLVMQEPMQTQCWLLFPARVHCMHFHLHPTCHCMAICIWTQGLPHGMYLYSCVLPVAAWPAQPPGMQERHASHHGRCCLSCRNRWKNNSGCYILHVYPACNRSFQHQHRT